jgi:shikimate kinase
MDAAENVVLIGGPGTGKSHVATALGILACCRFHGHEDKIVTKETEIGHGETEVHEGVQV